VSQRTEIVWASATADARTSASIVAAGASRCEVVRGIRRLLDGVMNGAIDAVVL
jgi:hypothetical protein